MIQCELYWSLPENEETIPASTYIYMLYIWYIYHTLKNTKSNSKSPPKFRMIYKYIDADRYRYIDTDTFENGKYKG